MNERANETIQNTLEGISDVPWGVRGLVAASVARDLAAANLLRSDDPDLRDEALAACERYATLIDRQLKMGVGSGKDESELMEEPAAVLSVGRRSLAAKQPPTLEQAIEHEFGWMEAKSGPQPSDETDVSFKAGRLRKLVRLARERAR